MVKKQQIWATAVFLFKVKKPHIFGFDLYETFLRDFDDGVRAETTKEGLAKLRPVFSFTGSVTAGNSSQTTDGAAATVLMSGKMVKELGVKPIAKVKCYTTGLPCG